jgi:glycosyltransferase involved in cell wall biosynthesis
MKKINIAILTDYPTPYRNPVFEEISKSKTYNFDIFSLYEKSIRHKEWNKKYDLPFNNICLGYKIRIPLLGDLHLDVFKIIKEKRYDLFLIKGYYPLTNLIMLLYLSIKKMPYIYAADTNLLPLNSDVNIKGLKNKFLQKVLKRSKAIWVPGNASLEYQHKFLNISKNKIAEGKYMFDTRFIYDKITKYNLKREELRKSLGFIDSDFVFLFVGKLIKKRNIGNLILAFSEASKANKNIALLIIGYGEEEHIVKNYLEENPDSKITHIHSVPFEELHQYYSCSDAYVHPGSEPYSLALVEAVIAGKAVVATNEVGATYDYVRNNLNGFIIPNNDIPSLTKSLNAVSKNVLDKEGLKEMQNYAVKIRDKYWAANELLRIIDGATKDF